MAWWAATMPLFLGAWCEGDSPLHRMARLRPRASAVPELMFSTSRCFTFFSTGTGEGRAQGGGVCSWAPGHPCPCVMTHRDHTRAEGAEVGGD